MSAEAQVVREHLGVILRVGRGWPIHSATVLRVARAFGARDSPYEDVADEDARMRERELLHPPVTIDAADGRSPCARKRVERGRRRRRGFSSIELAQNTFPTTAASCSRLFSESGSPSRRAAMMP